METERTTCSATRGLSACEAVCRNDGTYDVCRYVMQVRGDEFDRNPAQEAAATVALEFTRRALETGCFSEQRASDCIALGDMNRAPGRWEKAGLEEDLDEAKRYYGKACLLKDPRGCTLAQEVTKTAEGAPKGK